MDLSNRIDRISVDFVLQNNKQHLVIDFFYEHTPMTADDLAKVLDVSAKKISDVHNQKNFLDANEAKKLAELFCIWCGC